MPRNRNSARRLNDVKIIRCSNCAAKPIETDAGTIAHIYPSQHEDLDEIYDYKCPDCIYATKDEIYAVLNQLQDSKCAICLQQPGKNKLSLDHCHETGAYRGLICASCNLGLGSFRDNIESLENAIVYLKKYAIDNPERPNLRNYFQVAKDTHPFEV